MSSSKPPDDDLEDYQAQSPDPFTEFERQRIRKLLQDDDRATWLRRQVRVLTPWVVALIGGGYSLWSFLAQHWKGTP